MGDFNINLLECEHHTDTDNVVNCMISQYLLPYIPHPTRATDHSATVIDNIFSDVTDFETVSGNIFKQIADNYSQFLILINVYLGNLGPAALDPEPLTGCPKGQVMRETLKEIKHLLSTRTDHLARNNPHNGKPQDYAKLQGLNKGLGNTEIQRGNASAFLFPKIYITCPKQFSKVSD